MCVILPVNFINKRCGARRWRRQECAHHTNVICAGSQHPHKGTSECFSMYCDPSAGGLLSLLISQPSLIGEPQVLVRSHISENKVELWPLHCVCIYMHTQVNTYTHKDHLKHAAVQTSSDGVNKKFDLSDNEVALLAAPYPTVSRETLPGVLSLEI